MPTLRRCRASLIDLAARPNNAWPTDTSGYLAHFNWTLADVHYQARVEVECATIWLVLITMNLGLSLVVGTGDHHAGQADAADETRSEQHARRATGVLGLLALATAQEPPAKEAA